MGKNKKQAEKSMAARGSDVKPKKVSPFDLARESEAARRNRKKLDPRAVTLLITASVLVIVLIVGAVIAIVDYVNRDPDFDYTTSDLSRYVELSRDDYKNYSLNIDIAKPHVKDANGNGVSDAEVAILSMIAGDVPDTPIDGALKRSLSIAPGDGVYFWYRAYIIDPNGDKIEVASNFSSTKDKVTGSDNEVIIGSNICPPGIELALVGKSPEDYPSFVKTTEGTVTADHVVYLNYTRALADQENAVEQTRVGMRLDLSDPEVYAIWGEILVGQNIADTDHPMSFTLTIDGKTYNYTKTTVSFVTDFENDAENRPIEAVGYYPYDYRLSYLANETVYYEIYLEGVVAYNEWHKNHSGAYKLSYDWTDEYVTKKVAESSSPITMEELMEFSGDSLTEKYESYAVKYLNDAYEQIKRDEIAQAMMSYYLQKAKIKKYPGEKVDEIYQEYLDDVEYQYDIAGGQIEDPLTGDLKMAESFDEFAINYLNLQYMENPDWKNTLLEMSKSLVAERLIMYYIMQQENLIPSEDVFNARLEAVKQEYIDVTVQYYLDYNNMTKDDVEDWDKFVEERTKDLFDYYDEDFFIEQTYKEIAFDEMTKYPTVSTLDERRAYPVSK